MGIGFPALINEAVDKVYAWKEFGHAVIAPLPAVFVEYLHSFVYQFRPHLQVVCPYHFRVEALCAHGCSVSLCAVFPYQLCDWPAPGTDNLQRVGVVDDKGLQLRRRISEGLEQVFYFFNIYALVAVEIGLLSYPEMPLAESVKGLCLCNHVIRIPELKPVLQRLGAEAAAQLPYASLAGFQLYHRRPGNLLHNACTGHCHFPYQGIRVVDAEVVVSYLIEQAGADFLGGFPALQPRSKIGSRSCEHFPCL